MTDTTLTAYSGPRLSLAHPQVKRLLAATFPEYRGRKVQLRLWTKPRRLYNYWDGGTRSYWAMVRMADGAVGVPTNDNPFRSDAHAEVDLPAGHLMVEHVIFCGKDLGIRVYAREDEATALTGTLVPRLEA